MLPLVAPLLTKKLVVPTASPAGASCSPFLPVSEYLYTQCQSKFTRLQYVAAHRSRRRPIDAGHFAIQSSVRFVPVGNLKRAVLLQLLDYGVSDQNFDAREESAVLESWDCDGMNVTQVMWLYRANVIAKATRQCEAE